MPIQTVITFLLGDVTSFKSLFIRAMAAILAFLLYFAFANQDRLALYLSENTYLARVKTQQEEEYPKLARERALMLYNTVTPNSVIIIGYTPQFSNEYLYVVAQMGDIKIQESNWQGLAVDKASAMYSANMLGEGFGHIVIKDNLMQDKKFVLSSIYLEDFKYAFAYPIFDLENSYSGAIILGWVQTPNDAIKNSDQFTRRLGLIVLSSARALGRAK